MSRALAPPPGLEHVVPLLLLGQEGELAQEVGARGELADLRPGAAAALDAHQPPPPGKSFFN